MDVATIDNEFSQLQTETQQATQAISDLAQKMQAAGQAGDANAREWILDLKSIALQIQQEQLQTQSLLQALHDFTVNQLQAPAAPVQQYQSPPPQYQQAQYEPVQQQQFQQPRGGTLSRFMGGGFGQSMTSGLGMGAGFGLADSVINAIFH
ncbi:MAG TPA: hypothetical protein VGR90_08380 [Acidimicrobiales bacterium]|nr:hypothetical protein [Acidimicrobiales bacterium]